MQVIRATAMGFCFGVRRALHAALSLPDPAAVTILGELVHNEEVLDHLARRGLAMLPESAAGGVPGTPAVLVTAHGISDRERARLEAAGRRVIDTTCPLVRRIHETARALEARGFFVLIVGKRNHVEVRGITGDLAHYDVIGKPEEVRAYDAARLGVVCQSTASPEAVRAVLDEIRRRNPGREIQFEPTICRPTRDRQAAAEALLGQAEALVVVGGRHSNNTLELVRLSAARGVPCLHVQSEDDLLPAWFLPYETVGLTAGTSTPEGTIEAVYQRLLAIGAARRAQPQRQIA